jgi:hypothetical protein
MTEGDTKHPTVGLFCVCSDYWSSEASSRPESRPSTSIKRSWTSWLPLFADQLEELIETLHLAIEREGYADAGTAMAEIANEFFRDGIVAEQIRNSNGGANALPDRRQAATQRQRRESPHTPQQHQDRDPTITHHSSQVESGPHGSQRRTDQHPVPPPARRVGRNGRRLVRQPNRSVSEGAAGAISTRGGRSFGPRAMSSESLAAELEGVPRLECYSLADLAVMSQLHEDQLRLAARDAPWLYEPTWIPKKSGGDWRRVHAPDDDLLKPTQDAVAHYVLAPLVVSPIAYGISGRSQIDAARLHARKPYVGSDDIENFFSSVTERVIRTLLTSLGFGIEAVDLLVRLVSLRGCLPQGAPTSPAIANLLLAASDRRLHAEAQRLGVVLTRFVDDYAISGSDRLAIIGMMQLIERELRILGLRSNPSKRSLAPRSERQLVHGLHVNSRVSIPKKYRNDVRREVFWARDQGCIVESRFNRIMGMVNYIGELHIREAKKLEVVMRRVRVVPDPKRRFHAARRGTWRVRKARTEKG